jgi:hypothetical protein
MMNARGEVHHRLDAGERGAPIRCGSDRADQDFAVVSRQLAQGAPDIPSVTRQHWRKMAADEAARAGHEDNGSGSPSCCAFWFHGVVRNNP